jgi:hypothetical protein
MLSEKDNQDFFKMEKKYFSCLPINLTNKQILLMLCNNLCNEVVI